jgi:hypothetical protein
MMKPDANKAARRFQILPVFLLTVCATTPAIAQGTPNRTRSSIGDVYVRSAGGSELRGQLLRLGPDTLTLLEQGSSHDIRLADVTRIEARGDSVKNGAIIGAAILAGWCAIVCPQGLDGYSGRDFGYIFAINTALGAAIGAGIDGMHVGRTTIYQTAEMADGRRPSGVRAFLSKRVRF